MVPGLYKWLLLCVWWVAGSWIKDPASSGEKPSARHPFYISVTEISHNEAEKSLEITCKVFAEDIEQVLEKNYKTQLDIAAPSGKSAVDRLLPDYMAHHLSLSVDGRPVKLDYIGFEKEKESVYCYFEVPQTVSVKKLDIANSILFDFNSSEINIIHATVKGKRQSTRLAYPEKQVSFVW